MRVESKVLILVKFQSSVCSNTPTFSISTTTTFSRSLPYAKVVALSVVLVQSTRSLLLEARAIGWRCA